MSEGDFADKKDYYVFEKLFGELSKVSGNEFFDRALKFMLETLDVDYGLIGTVNREEHSVTTDCVRSKEGPIPNMEYSLNDTPFENLLGESECIFCDEVQAAFPKDVLLAEMSIRGYVGTSVEDCEGNPVGIIVLLSTREIENREEARRIFRIFGNRVALEMERNRAEIELMKAKERAEESDRLKSAFLANMSHELRTPLNGIMGFAQLLEIGGFDEEKQREYGGYIASSGQHLLGIVEDLIDVAHIESGQMELKSEPFDLNELFRELYAMFLSCMHKLNRKGIELFFPPQMNEPAPVIGDERRVRQILTNLICNALKFTESGEVRVTYARSNSGRISFEIEDTGGGIAKVDLDRIFERFEQGIGSAAGQKHQAGVGLGLAITKGLIELMGGQISVESEVGVGSRFLLEFDLECQGPVGADADGSEVGSLLEEETKKGIRFLVAEDDDMNYEVLKAMLDSPDLRLERASDGREAVELFSNNGGYDLILMDARMPVMDGCEATRRIREMDGSIPIIMQSAGVCGSDMDAGFDAGCSDFIAKPIMKALLDEVIAKHI